MTVQCFARCEPLIPWSFQLFGTLSPFPQPLQSKVTIRIDSHEEVPPKL